MIDLAALLSQVDVPSQGWMPALIVGVAGALGSWLTYRQATRVARAAGESEARKLDSAAYDRAKAWMDDELRTTRTERDEDRATAARLRLRVTELEDQVAHMRRRLIVAGFDDAGR